MQFAQQNLTRQIAERLSTLGRFVGLNTATGSTDFNSGAENFFCSLLNAIYKYELVNLNLEKMNFPAIDLGDKSRGVCFQITSDGSGSKLRDTLAKFERHNLDKDYSRIILLVISDSNAPKVTTKIPNIDIETWCLANLARDVSVLDINTLEHIEKIFAARLISSIRENPSILDSFNVSVAKIGECDAFINSLGYVYTEEEKAQIRTDLEGLSEKLALLANEEKAFLYISLVLGSQARGFSGYLSEDKFYVPCATLDARVTDGVSLFRGLEHRNLMSYVDDYFPDGAAQAIESLSIHFYGKSEFNYFVALKKFLPNDAALRQVFLSNDFACLN